MGLSRAGFDVTGVDICPQPRYPFVFVQADALTFPLGGYRLIWASPPCQHYSLFSRNLGTSNEHPDLIPLVRERLRGAGTTYIIENVEGAPLLNPTMLCGTMFGMKLIRHRLFETSFQIASLTHPCNHRGDEVPVYGKGTPQYYRKKWGRNIGIAEKRAAMRIDWMTRDELTEAIPPAYSQWLAERALREMAA
jgi:DNA (cytosine-5)-methyltransferase 1